MKYQGNKFQNETVRIDGNEYQGCTFEGCVLEYAGGALPIMTNNSIGNSTFAFTDAASNTLEFMTAIYHGMGDGGKNLIDSTFQNIRSNKKPMLS
ncbi:MAG: hypothetical protein K1563_20015 [Candidatus Thiodiazotropha sp. (ex. Lucinisca nassula)]|nr:hypothetical protein [Candidatus Thiodiazotropha sp. (ex. Lucinisca nassula)]